MAKVRTLRFLGLCLAGVLLSCASQSGMREEPLDAGVARSFRGSFAKVLRATRVALENAGLTIEAFEQPNSSTAIILADADSSAWSWGELVRVVVIKPRRKRVVVRVFTRAKLATNVTAKHDYSDTVFSNIRLALK